MNTYLVYGKNFEYIFSSTEIFLNTYLVYGNLFEDIFSLRKKFSNTYLVYGNFFEGQKRPRGQDLALSPVKRAFFSIEITSVLAP